MPTKPRRQNWIPVVAGLISRKGRVLLGQRPEGQTLPGLWEFPGGKIESGESPEQALKRELREELGIDAEIGSLVLAATHSYAATGIVLLFYHVDFWKGELKTVHHTKLQWVRPEDLHQLPLPEANRKILPQILTALGTHGPHHVSP